MNNQMKRIFLFLISIVMSVAIYAQPYKHIKTALYCRAYEVKKMTQPGWLESVWDTLSRQVHIDKVYLETHRDLLIVDDATLEYAKKFFLDRGVKVAGGITYTIDESNNFRTFCYSNPEDRKKVREIAEHTARHFDEFILDDFFFTNCKCDRCIEAKGDKSWTDYRLELMKNAAEELVINAAKNVNPDVQIIIKYPNWYEHFQGLGFNLEEEPPLFDGLYTGTETRDRSGNQHLQQYLGYTVMRYYENLKPGGNRGGWVDPGGLKYMDRYAEQLWITLFAKAREITLFDIRQMNWPIREELRADWKGIFDFNEMLRPIKIGDGDSFVPTKMSRAAGYSFELVDNILGYLGNPIGVKSYKPFHSVGEDFLQNYIGMIGIPIELVPEFPDNEPVVLLTETASYDPDIVVRIKTQLNRGGDVVVTSGFYKAMQGKGIESIVELRVTDRKANVQNFVAGVSQPSASQSEMLIPQINYLTNDSWEIISALDDTNGWPILHSADYAKGRFYVWAIPDNFVDLYQLPVPVLNRLRKTVAGNLNVSIEGPGEVALFVYDNNTFVLQSFRNEEVTIHILLDEKVSEIVDIEQNEKIGGQLRKAYPVRNLISDDDVMVFEVKIKPHSFRGFRF